MGGFVIDTRNFDCNYLPDGRQRMTLTVAGLKLIAAHNPELIPDISESEIRNKSKANAFTKIVTSGQASWFGIQCLTRVTQGLSISLLEINTAVHAVCALLLYVFFWWKKPLDVDEPTPLTNTDIHPLGALMAVRQVYPIAGLLPTDRGEAGIADGDVLPDDDTSTTTSQSVENILSSTEDRNPYSENSVDHGFEFEPARRHSLHYRNYSESDHKRFELASEAATRYGLTLSNDDILELRWPKDLFELRARNRPRSTEIYMPSRNAKLEDSVFGRGFALEGLFYGGIHLAVWNRAFRGAIDELFLKISSLTILCSGPVEAILLAISDAVSNWNHYQVSNRRRRVLEKMQSGFSRSVKGIVIVFLIFYFLCRGFIIVEYFLDVFHLPDSAFDVPRWSQYVPHIG